MKEFRRRIETSHGGRAYSGLVVCCRCRRTIRTSMAIPYRNAEGKADHACNPRGFMGPSCAQLCDMPPTAGIDLAGEPEIDRDAYFRT